jgi:hypothetical protein
VGVRDYALVWKKWFPLIEHGARELSVCMLAGAGLQAGQRVLDVATGIGSRCCRRQVVSVPGKYRKN